MQVQLIINIPSLCISLIHILYFNRSRLVRASDMYTLVLTHYKNPNFSKWILSRKILHNFKHHICIYYYDCIGANRRRVIKSYFVLVHSYKTIYKVQWTIVGNRLQFIQCIKYSFKVTVVVRFSIYFLIQNNMSFTVNNFMAIHLFV